MVLKSVLGGDGHSSGRPIGQPYDTCMSGTTKLVLSVTVSTNLVVVTVGIP